MIREKKDRTLDDSFITVRLPLFFRFPYPTNAIGETVQIHKDLLAEFEVERLAATATIKRAVEDGFTIWSSYNFTGDLAYTAVLTFHKSRLWKPGDTERESL